MEYDAFIKNVYEQYCSKVVKELVGRRRMLKRIKPIINKMVVKYTNNIELAKKCTITIYGEDDSENEPEDEIIHFDGDIDYEAFVTECYKDDGISHNLDYKYEELIERVNEKNKVIRRSYRILYTLKTLLYDDLIGYIYELDHCLGLDDVYSKLGHERRCETYDYETKRCLEMLCEFLVYSYKLSKKSTLISGDN